MMKKIVPIMIIAVFACLGFSRIQASHATVMPHMACDYHIKRLEKEQGIPAQLLLAIAKVESGHMDQKQGRMVAWPWTINVQGKGYKFRTKLEAVQAIKKHLADGVKSIDVGCMQVNLAYHGDAFESIEQAIEPKQNVEYAAQFLRNLRNEHASWTTAVAHYHSATPAHHIPYRQKVFEMWFKERRTGEFVNTGIGGPVEMPAMAAFRTLRFNPLKNRLGARSKAARAGPVRGVRYYRGQINAMTEPNKATTPSPSRLRPVMMSRYFKSKPHIQPVRRTSVVGRPHTIRFRK
jgi:hypothetical protein